MTASRSTPAARSGRLAAVTAIDGGTETRQAQIVR
jgi:hypothetical protein